MMKAGDLLFLDTNILLSATDESRASHKDALSVFPAALTIGIHLAICAQVIREYLVVATRPVKENGLGLGREESLKNIERIRLRTVFLEETEDVSNELRRLVSALDIRGKRIHDANIAVVMRTHGVHYLLTENPEDFALFSGIDIINPTKFALNLTSGSLNPP